VLTDDDKKAVREASWRALRFANAAIEREDLLQVGLLSILRAETEGLLPNERVHRKNYVFKRALGSMVDHIRSDLVAQVGCTRRELKNWRATFEQKSSEEDEAFDPLSDASDYSTIRSSLQHIAKQLKPNGQVFIEALLEGVDEIDAMTMAGVPYWNRTKYRSRFFTLVRRWL
jgi:hypothetical protein